MHRISIMDDKNMTMKKTLTSTLLGLALLLVASTASAQEFSQGVRAGGLGEAYTAVASGVSGIYHNPAGIARSVMYEFGGSFEYTESGSVLNATVVDSKTNPALAAGVGYSYFFGRDEAADIKGHDIRLALGVPIVPDRISIGLGGRYLLIDAGDVELMNGFTLDAGTLVKVTDQFHVGVVGQNLIDECDKIGCESVAPTTISGGLAFGSDVGFILSGDIGFDLTSKEDEVSLKYAVGAEYMAVSVPLRIGFERTDVIDQSLLTFGAGWRSKSAGFDAAYQIDVAHTDSMFFLGSFSIYL